MNFKRLHCNTENYPKGRRDIRDISLADGRRKCHSHAVREIVQYATDKKIDMTAGPEARGFIVGCPAF